MADKELNARQQAFVNHYMMTGNGAQSARMAGYSPNGAAAAGSRLLRNVKVKNALAAANYMAAERAELTTDMIVQGLLKEALKPGTDTSQGSRVAAWAHLGKYQGMFVDRVDLTVEPSVIEFIVAEPGDTELEVKDVPLLTIGDNGHEDNEDGDNGAA